MCIAGYDDIETSPYEDIELELVRNTETSKLASIVSGTAATSAIQPNTTFSSTAECTVMMDVLCIAVCLHVCV